MPQKTAVSGVLDFPSFTGIARILEVSGDSAATIAGRRAASLGQFLPREQKTCNATPVPVFAATLQSTARTASMANVRGGKQETCNATPVSVDAATLQSTRAQHQRRMRVAANLSDVRSALHVLWLTLAQMPHRQSDLGGPILHLRARHAGRNAREAAWSIAPVACTGAAGRRIFQLGPSSFVREISR